MTVRRAHGRAAKLGALAVVETLPADELPRGEPDPSRAVQAPPRRGRSFQAGDPHTLAAARLGGRSRRARTALAHTLGVTSEDADWSRFLRQAEAFRRAQVTMLAATVGGGVCGPAPAALVASAALALAASRLAYSKRDFALAARLAAEVRQHLLGAHELCAREAAARPRTNAALDAIMAAGDDGEEGAP